MPESRALEAIQAQLTKPSPRRSRMFCVNNCSTRGLGCSFCSSYYQHLLGSDWEHVLLTMLAIST